MSRRNPQQQRCYDAEGAARLRKDFPPSPAAQEFLAVPGRGRSGMIHYADCGLYVAHVLRQDWFVAAYPNQTAPIYVVGGSGSSSASQCDRTIAMSSDHRHKTVECEWVCLHELAHMITVMPPIGTDAHAAYIVSRGHAHAFRVNYVRLVRGQIGDRAAYVLRRSFESHAVPTHRLARSRSPARNCQ